MTAIHFYCHPDILSSYSFSVIFFLERFPKLDHACWVLRQGAKLNLEFCVTIYDHCRLTYWWSKFRQILKPGILCSSNHFKENAT